MDYEEISILSPHEVGVVVNHRIGVRYSNAAAYVLPVHLYVKLCTCNLCMLRLGKNSIIS